MRALREFEAGAEEADDAAAECAARLNELVEERTRELAAANARLKRSEALLAHAQRLSLTGSFAWCPESGAMFWSEQTYRLFEMDPDQPLTPDDIYARLDPRDEQAFRDTVNAARASGEDIDREFRVRTRGGEPRYLRFQIRADRDAEGRLEYFGAIQDVSERRRAERVALQNERRMAEIRSEVAHASRLATVGQLSAAISHDVRQPLSSVVLNGHAGKNWLAGDPPNIAGAIRALDKILAAGERATDILNRTRSFAKKEPPQKTPVNINAVIVDAIGLIESDARRRVVTIATELASRLQEPFADRVQVQQVVMNLLVNAMEALEALDTGAARHVLVRSWNENDREIGVSVGDTGPGVPSDQRGRLFDAFYTTKRDGMGMGLAICRDIIEAHGGRLWVDADRSGGSTFTFILPLEAACDGRAGHEDGAR
jgi:signal transduction histidine kinase